MGSWTTPPTAYRFLQGTDNTPEGERYAVYRGDRQAHTSTALPRPAPTVPSRMPALPPMGGLPAVTGHLGTSARRQPLICHELRDTRPPPRPHHHRKQDDR